MIKKDKIKFQTDNSYKDIIDLLQMALKLCDDKSAGPRQPLYAYRKALIHGRLARVFHCFHKSNLGAMKKVHSQLCNFHYDQAFNILKEIIDSVEDGGYCLMIRTRQIELNSTCAEGRWM